MGNKSIIDKIIWAFGGKTQAIVISSVLAGSFLFSGIYVQAVKAPADRRAKKAVERQLEEAAEEQQEVIDALAGTYVGGNGSLMIIKDDMTAIYYYPGFGMYDSNEWSVADDKITMTLACMVGTSIQADIDDLDDVVLDFVGVEGIWDEEVFYKISDSQDSVDETEADSLINGYLNPTEATEAPTEAETEVETEVETEAVEETEAAEETTEATEETTTEATTTETTSAGVTPSFKQTMDDYEAFMNSYVSFMRTYTSTTDYNQLLNMMSEYTSLMSQYETYVNEIDSIDTDSLSPADLAYYLEVTTRVANSLAGMI